MNETSKTSQSKHHATAKVPCQTGYNESTQEGCRAKHWSRLREHGIQGSVRGSVQVESGVGEKKWRGRKRRKKKIRDKARTLPIHLFINFWCWSPIMYYVPGTVLDRHRNGEWNLISAQGAYSLYKEMTQPQHTVIYEKTDVFTGH